MKTEGAAALAVFSLFLAVAPGPVQAEVWQVNAAGTGDAPTIQAGIDSADAGDEVVLAPGVYTGLGNRDVEFKGKAVTVRSSFGPEPATVDCQGLGRGFLFVSGEGASSVLSFVRVINGAHPHFGGAVFCKNASPTITDSYFEGNQAGFRGGAVYCDTSVAAVNRNTFENNQASYGGAVSCVSAHLEMSGNYFAANTALISGGAVFCRGSNPSIEGSLFEENTAANDGGAIYCDRASTAVIRSSMFRNNSAQGNGGAVASIESSPVVEYNLFCSNQAALGGAVFFSDFSRGPIRFNTFDANAAAEGSGGAVFCTNYSGAPISNNIVVNSTIGDGVGTKNDSMPVISCCCLFNNAGGDGLPSESVDGGGNFTEDPQFCGIDGSGNYYLQSDSPCASGNRPGPCGLVGALGVDCGTTPAQKKSWGGVKSLYEQE